MSALEDPQAQWVSMVMARVQKLEEQQEEQKQTIQEQHQTIQKLQEHSNDQLLLYPKNPLQLLAAAFRILVGKQSGADEDLQVIYLPTDEKGEFVPFAGRRIFYIYKMPGRPQRIEIEQLDQGPSGECKLDKLPGLYTFKDFDLAWMDGCPGWRMARFRFVASWGEAVDEWVADDVTDRMLVDPEEYETSGSDDAGS